MVARRRGRYLAPLALLLTILAIVLVVRGGLQSKSNPGATPATPTSVTATTQTSTTSQQTFYVVQPGDSLSTISAKTHISIGQIEALNPGINPNVLQSGQRLRLGH